MLVLSRERDEVVVITLPNGQKIEVTVVDIRGDKVRLGFTADKSIDIHRKEVHEAIEAEKKIKPKHMGVVSVDLSKKPAQST